MRLYDGLSWAGGHQGSAPSPASPRQFSGKALAPVTLGFPICKVDLVLALQKAERDGDGDVEPSE